MTPEPQAPGLPAEIVHCPACGGADSTQVGQEATAFVSVVAGHTFHQPAYTIRRCDGCDLYFKSHTLSVDRLDAYYERLESGIYEIDGNYPTDRILRHALERLADGSRVLDFGCSGGRILGDFTGRFECFGVEPNEQAADTARRRGLRVVSEEELRAGHHGDFDAIVLADVYEHLPQPLEITQMLVNRLKPNGWLAIVTGNADAVRTRPWMAEYWYFRTPGHLLMLSERHVSWLAGRLGLDVEALHRCSHYATSVRERLRQFAQSAAYYRFRETPRTGLAAALRLIPYIRRAASWPTAPALTYRPDHVVALLRKRAR
jgi:SAM-dependent methyltransferase